MCICKVTVWLKEIHLLILLSFSETNTLETVQPQRSLTFHGDSSVVLTEAVSAEVQQKFLKVGLLHLTIKPLRYQGKYKRIFSDRSETEKKA